MHLLRHKVGSASKRLEQQRTVGYRGVQIRMRCSTSSCYYTPHCNRSPMNFPVPWMQSFSVSTLALTNGFLLPRNFGSDAANELTAKLLEARTVLKKAIARACNNTAAP